MRILLRIVAVVVALAVVMTALMIVQLAVIGSIMAVGRSGALGALTIAGWIAILTVGPVATDQLWRLRRMGLTLAIYLHRYFERRHRSSASRSGAVDARSLRRPIQHSV
jgi:hypothetical protein